MRHRKFFVILSTVVAIADPTAAYAQTGGNAPEPGADLTVSLVTFGPGDQVWEKFGHNAIWIHDRSTGTTISYNYGMFSFDQVGFIPRLMKGSMLYSMDVRDATDEVYAYQYFNRSITRQQLNMTAAQKHSLREFLEWNWLPDNRDYLYDYFRDNCSTRLRDALDRVLAGRLRATLEGVPTGSTYRSHSLRLTAASVPVYTGLLVGLGMPTDQPIDAWQESFIPMKLMEHMRSVTVTDENGEEVPFVAAEEVIFDAGRVPPPASPPSRTWAYLLAGVVIASVILGLAWLARPAPRATPARVALAGIVGVWSVTAGLLGLILSLLWLFTDHTAAYPNQNLLLLNPLSLVLAVAGPLALGRQEYWATSRVAVPIAVAVLGLATIGLLLHFVPGADQSNGPLVALVVPVHTAILLVLYSARRPAMSSEKDVPVQGGPHPASV